VRPEQSMPRLKNLKKKTNIKRSPKKTRGIPKVVEEDCYYEEISKKRLLSLNERTITVLGKLKVGKVQFILPAQVAVTSQAVVPYNLRRLVIG
jgi:hypothetical protein